MATTYSVRELRAKLSKILERVEEGEKVVVTRRGKPVVELTPARGPELPPWPDFEAIRARVGKIKGIPMSQLVIRMRDEERY